MKNLKKDFPLLSRHMHGKPIIYLDSAATTQKPQHVLDAMNSFYTNSNANIHRGVYQLAEEATALFEKARSVVAQFINAHDPSEIVFTRSTTESINLVAATWGWDHVNAGDEIVITELEHHSNLLPWQRLAQQKGATLRFIPVNGQGDLELSMLPQLITHKTKLVAVSHVSHVLGVHNDIATIINAAHAVGAKVLIDAAQSVPHQRIDVQSMGADFLAFSGHKMLGPTGIGVLFVAKSLHDQMQPYQVGGGMVYEADFYSASWLAMPRKLEAGTPAIAQAHGLAAAIDYLQENVDWNELRSHEASLTSKLIDGLLAMPRIQLLGNLEKLRSNGHMLSFTVEGMHPHDVAAFLDTHAICVRAGHHCAQPLAKKLGIDASVRASFYCYNTTQDIDALIYALKKL